MFLPPLMVCSGIFFSEASSLVRGGAGSPQPIGKALAKVLGGPPCLLAPPLLIAAGHTCIACSTFPALRPCGPEKSTLGGPCEARGHGSRQKGQPQESPVASQGLDAVAGGCGDKVRILLDTDHSPDHSGAETGRANWRMEDQLVNHPNDTGGDGRGLQRDSCGVAEKESGFPCRELTRHL